ncbi:MAG TPA: protein translocase subunit SecD [Permianibacter sp.]|nr:protein translocase subunit SecD [Permianibacter sp.]
MLFGTPAVRPINTYPVWKYLLIGIVFLFGIIYSLPNLYGEDPALQLSAQRSAQLTEAQIAQAREVLNNAKLPFKSVEQQGDNFLIRFNNTEDQLKAQQLVRKALGGDVTVALNLAPATPAWLTALGASPMKLGLDLRGGIHFLIEIDMETALGKREEQMAEDFKSLMREEGLRYASSQRRAEGGVQVRFRDADSRDKAIVAVRRQNPDLVVTDGSEGEFFYLNAALSDQALRTARSEAVEQNLTILRNRVNELGVAEPVIQRQGAERIVVQLPGVQDSARAREILSATATLEFRMVNEDRDVQDALAGRIPADSELLYEINGQPHLVKKQVIVRGENVVGARSGLDQNNFPKVSVDLDGKGGQRMLANTKANVGKQMASVLIEFKPVYEEVDGQMVPVRQERVVKVINAARINGVFGPSFEITGVGSPAEAQELALLLRSGALTAPIQIVEERTIGPSMGQDNIDMGMKAMAIALAAVMGFMLLKYKVFGIATNIALFMNLALTVAVMSLIPGAVLTMPGIAGLVLGVAMAVDANVLINERIREDMRGGMSPAMAIQRGYDEASQAITDSNLTNLISGLVLFGVGSGTIKGFAVTLCIGILASMFTAVTGTRAIINLIYGGRDVKKIHV